MKKILVFILGLVLSVPAWAASIINDTEVEQVLTELISPLAKSADIPDGRLKIHIINSDEFNAFVMGGEDVYIYTGLLTQIKSPSALQAVVAHELGHTLGGHMAQMADRMEAELKRTALIQALGVGLMVAGGNPSLGAGVLAGSSGVAQQSMLAFSRDEERIADNMGVDLMIKSGLDPNGFIEVFEQMHDMTGAFESKVNPNRINHPLTSERLSNVKERINKTASGIKHDKDLEKIKEYDLVRAKLIGYLDNYNRVFTLYPYSDKSDAGIYARAIANMRKGDLELAKTGTQTLVSRQETNPYFYELLGDIEYQLGNYDDSVAAYEKSLALVKSAPQIETALALVLTERKEEGDIEKAIELCKSSLLKSHSPLTYWVLARAYGEDDGRADWAMAEFYHMNKDEKNATKYAKLTRKKLKKDSPEYIKAGELLK